MRTSWAARLALAAIGVSLVAAGTASGTGAARAAGTANRTPSGIAGELTGVAATSPTNAWAVGMSGADDTLLMHWNGKT